MWRIWKRIPELKIVLAMLAAIAAGEGSRVSGQVRYPSRAAAAAAAPGMQAPAYATVAPGGPAPFYSWRFGTNLVLEIRDLTPYGSPGARYVGRVVGPMQPGTPAWQMGLQPGDVITRIDGLPISGAQEFDSHYAESTVTFIKPGAPTALMATTNLGAPPQPAYPPSYPPAYPPAYPPGYPPSYPTPTVYTQPYGPGYYPAVAPAMAAPAAGRSR